MGCSNFSGTVKTDVVKVDELIHIWFVSTSSWHRSVCLSVGVDSVLADN